MEWTRKTAWKIAFLYVGLVYAGLYFTPFINDYLQERGELGSVIRKVYWIAGIFLFGILYFKFKVRDFQAYGMIVGVLILFFAAFSRVEMSTDRLHFLEHGLIYIFIYMALQFSNEGVTLIGRAIFICLLIALVDEKIQGLLPNRQADWRDIWTNLFSYYLAAGLVAVVHYYRRDYGSTSG